MVQCHLCQTWAHFTCIDEKEDDVIGLWCCNSCRNLPKTVSLLCDKITDLQQNVQALLFIACSTLVHKDNSNVNTRELSALVLPTPSVSTERQATTTITTTQHEDIDMPVADVQVDLNSTSDHQDQNNSTKALHQQEAPVPRRYVPKKNHDVYMHVESHLVTEGAVRSYLQDIGVIDIIRVSKIAEKKNSSEFRMIIGDETITNTLYGRRKFRRDATVMPFRRFRSNIRASTHHHMTTTATQAKHTKQIREKTITDETTKLILPAGPSALQQSIPVPDRSDPSPSETNVLQNPSLTYSSYPTLPGTVTLHPSVPNVEAPQRARGPAAVYYAPPDNSSIHHMTNATPLPTLPDQGTSCASAMSYQHQFSNRTHVSAPNYSQAVSSVPYMTTNVLPHATVHVPTPESYQVAHWSTPDYYHRPHIFPAPLHHPAPQNPLASDPAVQHAPSHPDHNAYRFQPTLPSTVHNTYPTSYTQQP